MTPHNAERALIGYADAYHKLYQRMPKDLRAVDESWVIVNGARIHAAELEQMTLLMQAEYDQTQIHKRSVVNRLIHWFKQ